MNEQIFKNNLRIIKESRTKQSEKINHDNDKEFRKWLTDKGLAHWLK